MRRIHRITEEVARWTFEVHVARHSDGWHVAFSNPTAGPWKRIMATNEEGLLGEVHRFAREETRPDLVLVHDTLRIVLIVEAKTKLADLLSATQKAKSIAVVRDLGAALRQRNDFWDARRDFQVVCGLLWGADAETTPSDAAGVIGSHERDLGDTARQVAGKVLGIECLRLSHANEISCRALHLPHASQQEEQFFAAVMRSLALPVTTC